jgi:multidrug resistance efflux pump
VQGFVEEISYTDGAFVKKSAPLFTIEPEPHRLKVETAKSAASLDSLTRLISTSEEDRPYSNGEKPSKERPSNKDAACISRQSQPEPSNLMSQILS